MEAGVGYVKGRSAGGLQRRDIMVAAFGRSGLSWEKPLDEDRIDPHGTSHTINFHLSRRDCCLDGIFEDENSYARSECPSPRIEWYGPSYIGE